MPNTVREDILDNLKTQLALITTAAGFDNTISNVRRWISGETSIGTTPAVVIKAGPETRSDDAYPRTTCRIQVDLELYVKIAEDDTTATDTRLDSLLGDITKKLKQDLTRGGKAVDTEITEVIPFESIEGEPEVGLIISVAIKYRHLETDPKTGI